MSRFKNRISRLEKGARKRENSLVTIKVISVLDEHWRAHEKAAKKAHLDRYGTLDNLLVVRSMVPKPGPPPTPEDLKMVEAAGGSNMIPVGGDNC